MRSRRAFFETLEPRRLLTGTISQQIIVDQFGWRADAPRKVAVFADPIVGQNSAVAYTPGASFQVRRVSDDAIVFTGSTAVWNSGNQHTDSGDKAWQGDFSTLTTPGDYYIYDPTNNLRSYEFKLQNTVFNDILKTSMRAFYYQRSGITIDAAHGGNWVHNASHVGANQDHAAKKWLNGAAVNVPRDVWGGWYDAGDYNRYVHYSTSPMWNLLTAYEFNPQTFADNWNIPESGNGVPDLLDEVKWELDWLLRMQSPNGAVLNRVANKTYELAGSYNPALDTQPRYYTQETTWATAGFAATVAHASRIFANFGAQFPGYAQTLLTAAQNAWNYLVATPDMFPISGKDGGGEDEENNGLAASGGDASYDDSVTEKSNADKRLRVLAAAELYKTTGSATYKTYFDANYKNNNTKEDGFHPLLGGTPHFQPFTAIDINHALVTYATTPGATTSIVNEIKASLNNNVTNANYVVGKYNSNADPYRAFMDTDDYSWGSNETKAEWANILYFAIKLNVGTANDQAKFREVAEEYLHYFHGRNPLSFVYLSNMGTKGANLGGDKSPMEIYHAWFDDGSPKYDGANSTFGPAPGYLVGGPNKDYNHNSLPPKGEPAMKAFKDFNSTPLASWEISEPAISSQAAYVLLLSMFGTDVTAPKPLSGSFDYLHGPHEMKIVFNEDITWPQQGGDLVVQKNGQPIDASQFTRSYEQATRTATYVYNGAILPNGNYHITLPAGGALDAAGNTTATPFSFDFFVLAGDADHNGTVNISDLSTLSTNWQKTGMLFKDGDFDYNNRVDLSDLVILGSNWQSPPLAAQAAPPPVAAVRRSPVRPISQIESSPTKELF